MKRKILTDQDVGAILSDPVKLSEEQKAQARENTDALGKGAVHTGYAEPADAEAKFWVNPGGNVGSKGADTYDNISGIAISSIAGALSAFLGGTAKRYDTITEALAEGAGKTDGTAKVLGYTCGGKLNIMLLDDMESSEIIEIAKDCTIHLNGHKLSFAKGTYLDIKTAGKVTINGTVAGSEITKNVEDGVAELLVSTNVTELHMVGGTYSACGNASAAFVPIRAQTGVLSKIVMSGCTVKVDASAGTVIYGVQTSGDTVIENCTIDIFNRTSGATAVNALKGAYSLTISDSSIASQGYGTLVTGVHMDADSLASENSYISVKAYLAGADGYGIVTTANVKNVTTTNCHIETDGHSDISKSADSGIRGAWAIRSDANTYLVINGGNYWGAREALAVYGTARINGGVFSGCQHGGAYLCGKDIKVKNAIFRNVAYIGECGWDEPNADGSANVYDGACYCGGSNESPTNVWFDNCRFEDESGQTYNLLVAKYTQTTLYLSNVTFTEHDVHIRCNTDCAVYIGKNVNGGSYTYSENGVVPDETTYADQEFGFETETTTDNAILCVKDERGNWVGVC